MGLSLRDDLDLREVILGIFMRLCRIRSPSIGYPRIFLLEMLGLWSDVGVLLSVSPR